MGEKYRILEVECFKWCNQAFQGIKEIIVTKKENYFTNQYTTTYKKKNKLDVKRTVIEYIPSRLIEGVCISALILIVCMSIIASLSFGILKVAEAVAFKTTEGDRRSL